MNTQSHGILTYFLVRRGLGRRIEGLPHLNAILFSGALAPDLPLYAFFFWYTAIQRAPQRLIWREFYFREGWQALFSSFHSLPLWAVAATAAWQRRKPSFALFCLSASLAAAQDFLLHHEDAHAHFFPFSNFRFRSPVSYWNPEYFGQYASLAEVVLVLLASAWVYRRLETWWGKAALVLAAASLLTNHAMWGLIFRTL